jgi:hypothetical protein
MSETIIGFGAVGEGKSSPQSTCEGSQTMSLGARPAMADCAAPDAQTRATAILYDHFIQYVFA